VLKAMRLAVIGFVPAKDNSIAALRLGRREGGKSFVAMVLRTRAYNNCFGSRTGRGRINFPPGRSRAGRNQGVARAGYGFGRPALPPTAWRGPADTSNLQFHPARKIPNIQV
jgi:hypothetical protein